MERIRSGYLVLISLAGIALLAARAYGNFGALLMPEMRCSASTGRGAERHAAMARGDASAAFGAFCH